jgi:APA family basic amino acid/polyamine antiporter
VQAILASLLVALGTFVQIVAYFVFVAVVFLGLTVAGTFRLRADVTEGARLRVPAYPYTPLAFLALVALLLALLVEHNTLQAALGVVVVMMGLPAYRLVRRRGKLA